MFMFLSVVLIVFFSPLVCILKPSTFLRLVICSMVFFFILFLFRLISLHLSACTFHALYIMITVTERLRGKDFLFAGTRSCVASPNSAKYIRNYSSKQGWQTQDDVLLVQLNQLHVVQYTHARALRSEICSILLECGKFVCVSVNVSMLMDFLCVFLFVVCWCGMILAGPASA